QRVDRELAAQRELPEPHRDVARRRNEAAVAKAQADENLPDQQKPDRRDQIKRALVPLVGRSAHRSISARARLTSSSSSFQISSLSRPNSALADSAIRSRGWAKDTGMISLMRPGCA